MSAAAPAGPAADAAGLLARIGQRIDGLGGWGRAALAAAAGLALTAAQPPYGLWPLVFIAIPLLIRLIAARPGPRAAAWIGWIAGAAFFLSGLNWVASAFLVDAERHGWMAPFAVALLGGGLGLFWAGACALARAAARGAWLALALPASLLLAEALRGWIFTGFPWALSAYAWADAPVAQASALIGPFGLGLATLLAAAAPAAPGRLRLATSAAALAALAGGWAYGTLRLAEPAPARGDGAVIRIVQANVTQREKADRSRAREIFERHLALTRGADADVILWPEAAVTFLIGESPEARAELAAATPAGGATILGALRVDRAKAPARIHNSLFVFDDQGDVTGLHDKHHLVPFGEYAPFADTLAKIGFTSLAGGLRGFDAGPPARAVTGAGPPPFAPMICYEIVFPREVAAAAAGADWIAAITVDAWFGDSAGPRQHLAIARFRAIEQGLPVARAASTGISAMIDGKGRIVASIPLNEAGFIDAALPAPEAATLYRTLGDAPALIAAALALLGAALLSRRRAPSPA